MRVLVTRSIGSVVVDHIARVAGCTPASAAVCERAVSHLGQVKGTLQCAMHQDILEAQMYLGQNAPFPYGDPRWDELYLGALHLFVAKTNRRVCLDLPPSKLLATADPPGWSADYVFGKTFVDEAAWKAELERVKATELANQSPGWSG